MRSLAIKAVMEMLATCATMSEKVASGPFPFKDNVHNVELYNHLLPILEGPFFKTFVDCGGKGKQRWLSDDVLTTLQKNNNWPTITFDGLSPSASKFAGKYLSTDTKILNIYLKNRFDGHPGVAAINTQPIWWCLQNKEHHPSPQPKKPRKSRAGVARAAPKRKAETLCTICTVNPVDTRPSLGGGLRCTRCGVYWRKHDGKEWHEGVKPRGVHTGRRGRGRVQELESDDKEDDNVPGWLEGIGSGSEDEEEDDVEDEEEEDDVEDEEEKDEGEEEEEGAATTEEEEDDEEDETAIANGKCSAYSIKNLGVFNCTEDAVEALDNKMDEYISAQHIKEFLGERGSSWHKRIIEDVLTEAGYEYVPIATTEMNANDSYLMEGVANDKHYVWTHWQQSLEPDNSTDNPRDFPDNWQHSVAIVKGEIIRETKSNLDMRWLHLDSEGKPDPEKGFFCSIDYVYKISKREEVEAEVEEVEADVEAEVASSSSTSNSRKRKLEAPVMSLNDKTEALRQQLGLVGIIPSVAKQASAMLGVTTTEDKSLVEKIEACYVLVFGA